MSEQPTIKSRPGGPLLVSGQVPLVRQTPVTSETGEVEGWKNSDPLTDRAKYSLCRCGASADMPFCDGAHNDLDFEGADSFGQPGNCTFGEDTDPESAPQIGVIDNGPLCVTGQVQITNSNGDVLEPRNRVTLCRCGKSANLPLCDGTHRETGFADSASE